MKRIGLLSDTHSYWDERYEKYFADVDEVWHAGDIGSTELAERFQAFKPFRAVCGNCDGGDLRRMFPDLLRFKCEDADIMIKHSQNPLRQNAPLPTYQSRCSRLARMAKGAHTCPLHRRRKRI